MKAPFQRCVVLRCPVLVDVNVRICDKVDADHIEAVNQMMSEASETGVDTEESKRLQEELTHLRALREIAKRVSKCDSISSPFEHQRSLKALAAKLQDIDIWESR